MKNFNLMLIMFGVMALSLNTYSQTAETEFLTLGTIHDGDSVEVASLIEFNQINFVNEKGETLIGYKIVSGNIYIGANADVWTIPAGGILSDNIISIFKGSQGKQVRVMVDYTDPEGLTQIKVIVFFIK